MSTLKNGPFAHFKNDALASVVVFLVALPLCLGIALASGAPLFSGIIAGILGGLVVGTLSNSSLSVSGPAAGLVVIVLSAIHELGSFPAFLAAALLAGIIQIGMGFIKAGSISLYFPSSVIKGMLASIGLILILKQIPHLIGVDADAFGEEAFVQADGSTTFSFLSYAINHVGFGSMVIGFTCLALIVFWELFLVKKYHSLKAIPAGLIVVAVGVGVKFFIDAYFPEIGVSPEHLVNLPVLGGLADIGSLFTFPDFSAFGNSAIYIIAVTLAIVASLESLLSIEAIDRLDPEKRVTNTNRELVAQGVGNSVSALLGGLPITAVIVRSSANLTAGARTKWAAVFHGVLLLVAVLLFPRMLNQIPLAALAAILIMVGFKLTKPRLYKEQFKLGLMQFIPFIITLGAILFTDLLVGILIGMGAGMFFVLLGNHGLAFFSAEHRSDIDGYERKVIFRLSQHVSFLNKASLQKAFDKLPDNVEVLIDGENTHVFDYDALETIHRFNANSKDRNILTTLTGIPPLHDRQNEAFLAELVELREEQTADEILDGLLEGNQRFITGNRIHRNYLSEIQETSVDQFPPCIMLSCIDSRAPIEIIFDQGIGDVFSVRVAGNVVNNDILASLEFGCKIKKSKLLLVLGHTGCGAVQGACSNVDTGHLPHLLSKIKPAIHQYENNLSLYKGNKIDEIAKINVELVINSIREQSEVLRHMEQHGTIKLAGAMYDIQLGKVELI